MGVAYADFFADRYYIDANGCWIWTGQINPAGYAKWNNHYAHILFHVEKHGPVPEGLELDHTCRVKRCVNPDHTEAVTHQVNVQRRFRWG